MSARGGSGAGRVLEGRFVDKKRLTRHALAFLVLLAQGDARMQKKKADFCSH